MFQWSDTGHPRSAVGHSSWERYGALLAEIRDLNRCVYVCIIFVHLFRSAALHQRLVGSGRSGFFLSRTLSFFLSAQALLDANY